LYKLGGTRKFFRMSPFIYRASNVVEFPSPTTNEDVVVSIRDDRDPVYLSGPDEGFPYRRA